MTEDAPISRPRTVRNRIFQAIFVVASLQTLYFTFQNHSTPLNEWPADLADHAAYCRPENYKSCRAGQWFGILKSRLAQSGGDAALAIICQNWAAKPDSASARMIETADEDMLYLCRMKDPATVDPAKVPK